MKAEREELRAEKRERKAAAQVDSPTSWGDEDLRWEDLFTDTDVSTSDNDDY